MSCLYVCVVLIMGGKFIGTNIRRAKGWAAIAREHGDASL